MPSIQISLLMDNTLTTLTQIPYDAIPMYTANPALILVTLDYVMDMLKISVPQGAESKARLIISDITISLENLHCNSWATRANIERNIISILYPSRRSKC